MKLVASAALLTFLFIVQPASADNFRFVDINNIIDVNQIVPSGTQTNGHTFTVNSGCGSGAANNENVPCVITISSPTGNPTSPTQSLNIAEAGQTQFVSDTVTASPGSSGTHSYSVTFTSDPPGDSSGLAPISGAPSKNENGNVQDAFTLHWNDGTSDTIQFRSDVDPVPEPGTIVLFGSSLVMAGGFLRRRSRLV